MYEFCTFFPGDEIIKDIFRKYKLRYETTKNDYIRHVTCPWFRVLVPRFLFRHFSGHFYHRRAAFVSYVSVNNL